MTTKEFTLTGRQTRGSLNTRLLGTLGMLASPMIFIEGLYAGFQQHGTDQFVGLIEVVYMAGWMCSIIGLYGMEAAGKRGGKIVLIIQLIGLFIAALWSASHIFVPNPNTESVLYIATDLSWPFSHLFINIVGVAVLRAKVWTDWRRFTPLLCGLALPAAILGGILIGETALGLIFGIWTTTALALLGYAVRTSSAAQ